MYPMVESQGEEERSRMGLVGAAALMGSRDRLDYEV